MANDTVLVADDEPEVLAHLATALLPSGYSTVCASNGREAWNLLVENPGGIVACVIDLQMPPGSYGGRDLVARIRKSFSRTIPIIIFSGRGTISLSHEVTKAGADDFIEKEAGSAALLESVFKHIANSKILLPSSLPSITQLAQSADLPAMALRAFQQLERWIRSQILSHFAPDELLMFFNTSKQKPAQHVLDKLAAVTSFTDDKKLSFGDLFEIVAALSALQRLKLPTASEIRLHSRRIVETRNALMHARDVSARELILAITSSDDLLEQFNAAK